MRLTAVAALLIAALALGCGEARTPSVDSAVLTDTDLAVLRSAIDSWIRPRLRASTGHCDGQAIVMSPTWTTPLWDGPPRSSPLPSPPEFRTLPPPLPPAALRAELLTPAERAAWQIANRRSREIPDLGIAGVSIARRTAPPQLCPAVGVTTPAYPTPISAVVYSDFVCGGACGEGWLIRLTKSGDRWSINGEEQLWIS